MSLLDEYNELQKKKNSGQSGRKSLLQEHVESKGTAGLNEGYVDTALSNGGGFGFTQVSKGPTITVSKRRDDFMKKWGHYLSAPDYKDYSSRGAAIKNPTMAAAERGITIFGKQIGGADVGNIVTYSRDNYQQIGMGEANGSSVVGKSLYHYMDDDEVGIYNYLLAKEGGKSAQAYLDDLEEDLNYRMGTAQAGTILSMDNPVVRAAAIAAASVGSGVDQWGSGVRQLLSDEKLPTSSAQFGSSVIAENLDGVGRYAYLAGNTIGNMAPSILLSSLTAGLGASSAVAQGVGNFALGTSAAGNAYGQALAEGYGQGQARTYGLLVGASEALLQKMIGGISSLGGISGKFAGKVAAIDNSLLRIAAKFGVSVSGEIVEEELQSFLEPAFRSVIFGEDYDAPTIEEMLETAIVTALSTGLLEGPSSVGGDIASSRYYKKTYGDAQQELVAKGLESPDGTLSKSLAQKYQEVLDSNGELSGHQLGRMVEANDQQFVAEDMTAMESAAAERLTALGETGDVSAISKALAKQAAGDKLTRAEKAILSGSKYGQRVANEMNPGNIQSGGYSTGWAQQIGTNRINAEAYSSSLQALADEMAGVTPTDAGGAEAGGETTVSASDSTPKPVMPVTERFTASGKGKTSIADMGKVQIASTEGGKLKLKTEGGQTVDADRVSFRSEDEAMVYSAVLDMGVSPVVAQSIVDNFDGTDGRAYAADVKLAYQYGKMNFPKRYLERLDIQPHQAEHAYNLGRSDAKAEVIQPKTKKTVKGKRGTVTFETAVDESTLTPIQRQSLNGIKAIADLSGLNVHVFASQLTPDGYKFSLPDGTVTGANGWYVTGSNDIWIDLNAGNAGEGTMLYTAAHEISHFIKEWSPAKWRVLADFLLEQYGEDVPLDALLERQMAKVRKSKPDLQGNALMDAAYEELVCDAMSEMLVDGEVVQKLSELKQKDRTLWEKIRDVIRDLLEKWGLIRKEYEGRSVAGEAEFLRGMDEAFRKLQQLYTEAFAEASENYQQTLAEAGIAVDDKTDSGSLFSVRDVLSEADRKKVAKALMDRFGVTDKEAMGWLTAETSMASLILNPKYSMYLDYEGDPNEVAIKQNSDYPQGTVDFSNICKKRREFTQVMNRVLRNFPSHVFAATDLAKIRTIMGQEGMTLPCGICYVEDRRQLDSIVAQDFVDGLKLYREGSKTRPDGKPFNANQLKGLRMTDGDTYVPSIYELVTLEGRNSLKAKNPNMEAAWVTYNNARGMQSVRLLTNEAEYKRQILKYNKNTVKSKNNHGGLRIYSFSDMEMFHLIDVVQVITDSAAVGLKIQGYTKVNEYAKAVRNTGLKLNRSLIPAGDLGYHMEGGRVVLDYDTVEGIDIHHEDFFDNRDNPNVGNIVIGINDTQIRAAMVDPFVDQIIPFHTGQSADVLGEKGIAAWDNYKDFQTEKDIATGRTSDHQVNIYTEVIQAAEQEGNPIQNKRQFVERFLAVCKKHGLKPRFAQFLNTDATGDYIYTEGYHKFLVDFKTFAQTEVGEYLPQMPVKPIFEDAYITGLLHAYVTEQKAKDAEVAKQMPRVIERITSEIIKPGEVKRSERDTAPTFYSHMARVVDAVKQEKLGASSVVSMLRGKGVKAEEIKWSGIEAWLEGKKSVTKAELQEFIAGSMLQIKETVLGGGSTLMGEDGTRYESETAFKDAAYAVAEEQGIDRNRVKFVFDTDDTMEAYAYVGTPMNQILWASILESKGSAARWGQYKLDGGSNYREIVFTMPDSEYGNQAMHVHWGEGVDGVLAHARIQDMPTAGGRMLFVEEIQSDWHNAGHSKGYQTAEFKEADRQEDEAYNLYMNLRRAFNRYVRSSEFTSDPEDVRKKKFDHLRSKMDAAEKKHREARQRVQVLLDRGEGNVPDAPFRETYHEYVMKRLIRMAVEGGYDSIGWTTADIQSKRWSDEFAEGYRIEYDQDLPKFMTKYGKKWGAKVEKADVANGRGKTSFITSDGQKHDTLRDAVEAVGRNVGIYYGDLQYEVTVDGAIVRNAFNGEELDRISMGTDGTTVWSMTITPAMKQPVLYEGQPLYSERDTDSVSPRSLLAGAFEGVAKDDIERRKIEEYRQNVEQLNEQERKLTEIREKLRDLNGQLAGVYAKIRETKSDTAEMRDLVAEKLRLKEDIRKLRDKATKTANRISNYDKILLRLEASKPLMAVLNREKSKAYSRASQKWADRMEKARTGRDSAEIRRKIKTFKAKLERSLLNPTDKQYVPIDLIRAMVDVCSLIDVDTDLYHADGSVNKAQEKRNLTKEKLQSLKDEYEKLKTHSDPIYAGEFDEMVYTYISSLIENFKGKPLREMSLDELTEMYEILRAIDDTLRDARKLIGWGDAEGVYEAGDAIVAEQQAITKSRKGGKRNAAQIARDKMLNQSLSPVRNVERMSGYHADSYLLKMFKKFEQGIRKKNRFVMEAYKSFEHLTSGKAYEAAMYTEVGGKKYTDINGRKFGISKMQMMQAILSYERETANHMNHIQSGGFTFADLDMLRKGKLRDAISEEHSHRVPNAAALVAEFSKILENDKWCQDYMAAARKFFNGTAKDAINETSIALKHRIIAKDKSYIPFEVDKNFVVREISAENDIQQTINSYGMLKAIKDGAPQPLIITGLNNILDRHIDQVGNVYGLAVEVRNFNKVWNVRALDAAGSDPTVKAAIQRNWGVEGMEHIHQAVQDIQGPRHNKQSMLYKKVKSGYIGATFLLNLSVVTKQIGSLYSATSMLKWRGPVRQLGNLLYTMANHKSISAEVDKYTASAWMRRQGLSDAEVHTFMTEGKKSMIGRLTSKLPTVMNPGKWITGMDHAVALSLWRYAKQDTAKRTGLTGEELLKATAEFYDEVIDNTQSMSDVLHRPEIQKRSDILSESFAMFKTDLFQMAGQLEVTAGRYKANKTKDNGKALGRTVYAIAMSAMWAQLMTTLFALLRYKVKPYRDEEDEDLTAESWLKRQGFALAGDLIGYILPLFGSETVGFFENIMYGESEDIVDSIALTAINDLYDTMTTVATAIKDGEMPGPAQMKKLVTKSLQVLGVPASNIIRTYEAIQLHAKDIANGEFFSFEAGADRTPKHHIHRIIEALDEGKTSVAVGLYEEALEETAGGEGDMDDAKSSLKTALGNKYKDGEITEDQVIDVLTKCFDYERAEAKKIVGEWAFKKEYGFSWSDRSDAYKSGAVSKQKMKSLLMSIGDKTADEAETQIKVYDWQNEGFDIDVSQTSVVADYEEFCKPAGITKKVYFDAYMFYKDAGETNVAYSKTTECMPYINSLPLTASQKTQLALCWWAESTVSKYKLW